LRGQTNGNRRLRLLAKYGYPPDAEADAIKRVFDQMETFADDWSPEA
jgi:type I restriction enzyme R subunit